MLTQTQLEAASQLANVRAFLRLIRYTEHRGTWPDDPRVYRRHFSGSVWPESEVAKGKPRSIITAGGYQSSACGAYQFLNKTWDGLLRAYPWLVFADPHHQDLAAIALIEGRKALTHVIAGRIEQAFQTCALEWASLPGSPYGQPTVPLAQCIDYYVASGGRINSPQEQPAVPANPDPFNLEPAPAVPAPAPTSTDEEQPAVPTPTPAPAPSTGETIGNIISTVGTVAGTFIGGPWLGMAIRALSGVAPELIRLFGSGGAITERNAKAAEAVGKIVMRIGGGENEQTAAHAIATDPAKLAEFRAALAEYWDQLYRMATESDRLDAELQGKAAERNKAATEGVTTMEQALIRNWPFILVGAGQFMLTLAGMFFTGLVIWIILSRAMSPTPIPDMPTWAVSLISGLLSSVVTAIVLEWRSVLSYVLGSTQGSAAKNILMSRQSGGAADAGQKR